MTVDAKRFIATVALLALGLWLGTPAARAAESGFLTVAADRGFQGNEEIRDAFDVFAAGRNAELAFATDERTRETLERALARLRQRGAARVLVLPVFLSGSDPHWLRAKASLERQTLPVTFARPYGESYLAVEALAERLRTVREPRKTSVVVAGYGADGPESRARLERDWQRIAARAAEGIGFGAVRSLVWDDGSGPDREARRKASRDALAQAVHGAGRTAVVPFHLGRRLDGMMSYEAELKRALAAGAELVTQGPGAEALVATWMAREANRHAALEPREIGVILLAHGSDYHWNETMREAVRPLEAHHPVEYVFSMADQPLIERAVKRLEKRGARAAVIVRVFGLASSFRDAVERMIGGDIERARAVAATKRAGRTEHEGHGHGMHDGHGAEAASPPARIRSPLPIVTVGGVEADPLFAAALLERARALSRDPGRETVILTAHGAGEDERNERWLEILRQLAAQMKAGGAPFREIRYATWREDWPGKREPWIRAVKDMVEEAASQGGQALVIPARTNGRGPERRFLAGMKFELGEGFAPHPLFLRWFEQQVRAGAGALRTAH